MLTRIAFVALFAGATMAAAETYYVDYESGDDTKAGTSAVAAWKHAPGDAAAKGQPAEVKLQPGDTVILKGGVHYAGSITITASGTTDAPVVYDGNTAGTFGEGQAIIDGGEAVAGWQRLESAEQGKGNPNWSKIYVTTIEPADSWTTLGLADARGPLPIAQSPNPSDPIFQTRPYEFFQSGSKMVSDAPVSVSPAFGARVNSRRPLIQVITPGRGSAVLSPVVGSGFTVKLDKPVTVTKVGIFMQPKYTPVKEVEIYGDDELLTTLTLEADKEAMQTGELDEPVTVRKFTWKFKSVHGQVKSDWTAIRAAGAFNEAGENVLQFSPSMRFKDDKVLTADDADFYDDMKLRIHGGHNTVVDLNITKFDPATHTMSTEFYGGNLYDKTRYSLMNSVKLIDQPGEYATESIGGGKWRLYLMPRDGDEPTGVRRSVRNSGIATNDASHVVVRGFSVRNQGGRRATGLSARGGSHVTFKDCEVVGVVGGTAVSGSKVDRLVSRRLHVHHNPGRTKGIVYHTCTNSDVLDSKLDRNTSTGLDYYICTGGRVAGNLVTGHYGIHANGITFYLGCRDVLIENNVVYDGNVALTIQEATDIVIRNNVFDGGGESVAVGIWTAVPFKNIHFYNNLMIRGNPDANWQTGLFSNNGGPEGLVFKNNIIDGKTGNLPGEYSHNIYTRLGDKQKADQLGQGEKFIDDLSKLLVDPANHDYRLKPDSPAIDAGTDVGVEVDIAGTKRPQGEAVDIGPYEVK